MISNLSPPCREHYFAMIIKLANPPFATLDNSVGQLANLNQKYKPLAIWLEITKSVL